MRLFTIMQAQNYEKGGSTHQQLRVAGVCFAVVGVPWDLMMKHEAQALQNHGQTLQRLDERGGLSAAEAIAVLKDRRFFMISEADSHRILHGILTSLE